MNIYNSIMQSCPAINRVRDTLDTIASYQLDDRTLQEHYDSSIRQALDDLEVARAINAELRSELDQAKNELIGDEDTIERLEREIDRIKEDYDWEIADLRSDLDSLKKELSECEQYHWELQQEQT